MTFYELGWGTTVTPEILVTKIAKFQFHIQSFREPLEQSVRQVFVKDIQNSFAVGGNPSWASLHDSTIDRKKRQGRNNGILKETGKLAREAARINNWKVTSDQAYWAGMNQGVSYGYAHNEGFINARTHTHVAKREWLRINDDMKQAILDVFDEWLNEREARYLA